jgi:S-methylmethionine-dependent homocysteine/selenocysteine methylase
MAKIRANLDVSPMNLIKHRLSAGEVVVLDGGVGALLYDRGMHQRPQFPFPWSLEGLVVDPKSLWEIHMDYIQSGADILTVSAYRTNQTSLQREFESRLNSWFPKKTQSGDIKILTRQISQEWRSMSRPLTQFAVLIASLAKKRHSRGKNVAIAANLTTIGDSYDPRDVPRPAVRYREHRQKVSYFDSLPPRSRDLIDLFLIETICSSREAHDAMRTALRSNT